MSAAARDTLSTARAVGSDHESKGGAGASTPSNTVATPNLTMRRLDEMFVTDITEKAKLLGQFKRAMEIWQPELPDIPRTAFHHRIGMNTTDWNGWPTAENPYVNGAGWHLTWGMILPKLEPVQ
jgi:peptide/nickel transport system substrate-binding protein